MAFIIPYLPGPVSYTHLDVYKRQVFIKLWPIVFMVSTSLKDMDQIFQATLNPLPLPPTLNNYLTVLGNFPLFTYIYNTFFIAAFVTVFKVLTSVLAAFAFIYYDFKYKETVFNSMLLTFFIPITVLIMPNYLLMSRLDLLNTPWGVMPVSYTHRCV